MYGVYGVCMEVYGVYGVCMEVYGVYGVRIPLYLLQEWKRVVFTRNDDTVHALAKVVAPLHR